MEIRITNLTFDGIPITVYDGVWCHNAVWRRVSLYHLEFYSAHASTHHEGIVTVDRPVCFHEVWFQVYFEQVAVDKYINFIFQASLELL